MSRNNTPWQALATAEIQWTEDGSPRSPAYDDFYYSTVDGVEEASYVFIEGNRLAQRLKTHCHANFCCVETGFGTGLNFLLSWKLWREQSQPKPRLHFVSIENQPVHPHDIRKALAAWPDISDLAQILLDNYPEPIPGQHRIVLEDGAVTLDLWWEDVATAIPEICGRLSPAVDAWFLDGFSPNRNPAMWEAALYHHMAAASRAYASFATFTAAGDVRRGLATAGFEVSKRSGWGLKRESMCGQLSTPAKPLPQTPTDTPWDLSTANPPRPNSALVIGAGLAGCTVASALAQRGLQVTVIERDDVASGGSGNDQGVLYTRLSPKHSPLVDFSLQSFSFSHHFYQKMLNSGALQGGVDGSLCGSFHQSRNTELLVTMARQLAAVPQLAQVLRADAANEMLGIEQQRDGYWYPRSGWMRPASICNALLKHDNISLINNVGDVTLHQSDGLWHAVSPAGKLAASSCAIVATGPSAVNMPELNWLPTSSIRGQTSHLSSSEQFSKLRAVLCHTGYISPARRNFHCIGATFDIGDNDSKVRTADHRYNLDSLAAAVPAWEGKLNAVQESQIHGRVAYRCASPDYLPLIGPVPNHTAFMRTYAGLSKNARQTIAQKGEYIPGLFVTTGHGSRGLTSTPLAAEILASTICNEPLPLSKELSRAVSPARFIIRNLRRKRT